MQYDAFEDIALEYSLGGSWTSAKAALARACEFVSGKLKEFGEWLRRQTDKFADRVAQVFEVFIKRSESSGVDLPNDTIEDINDTINEYGEVFEDTLDGTLNRHREDLKYEFADTTEEDFQNDEEDIKEKISFFERIKQRKIRMSGKSNGKLDKRFFRELRGKVRTWFNKAVKYVNSLSGEYDRCARAVHQHIYEPQSTLGNIVVNVVAAIILLFKVAFDVISSIVSGISRIILKIRGIDTHDVSDQHIQLDPIIIGIESFLRGE